MKKILITLVICASFMVANDCERDDSTGFVTCKDTKLVWMDKKDKIVQKKWNKDDEQATKYCSDLGDGWRLPNINELLSIVDYSRWNPSINQAFNILPAETRFYSSTSTNNTKVFFMEFENGTTSRMDVEYGGNSLSVRCVKDLK